MQKTAVTTRLPVGSVPAPTGLHDGRPEIERRRYATGLQIDDGGDDDGELNAADVKRAVGNPRPTL